MYRFNHYQFWLLPELTVDFKHMLHGNVCTTVFDVQQSRLLCCLNTDMSNVVQSPDFCYLAGFLEPHYAH